MSGPGWWEVPQPDKGPHLPTCPVFLDFLQTHRMVACLQSPPSQKKKERNWYQSISEEQNLFYSFIYFYCFGTMGSHTGYAAGGSPLTPDPLASPSLVLEFHVLPWLAYKRKIFPETPSKILFILPTQTALGFSPGRENVCWEGSQQKPLEHKVTYSSPKESPRPQESKLHPGTRHPGSGILSQLPNSKESEQLWD